MLIPQVLLYEAAAALFPVNINLHDVYMCKS
jgi:hypothetical protein